MENNNSKQTYNKAFITGKLKEKKLDFKVSSTGKEMCMGYLVVACETPNGVSEIRCKILQMRDKKDGKPNPLYKALETINTTYQIGEPIRVEGKVEDGTYFNTNKEAYIEKMEINGYFIGRPDADAKEGCIIAFEGVVIKSEPKEDGDLDVKIVGFAYNGVAVPVNAVVSKENALNFQNSYQIGCSSQFNIAVINSVIKQEIQKEVGFGQPLGEAITKTVTKTVVFGAENPKYDKFTEDDVKQGMAKRLAELEQKKEDAKKKNGGNISAGFSQSPIGNQAPNNLSFGETGFNFPPIAN